MTLNKTNNHSNTNTINHKIYLLGDKTGQPTPTSIPYNRAGLKPLLLNNLQTLLFPQYFYELLIIIIRNHKRPIPRTNLSTLFTIFKNKITGITSICIGPIYHKGNNKRYNKEYFIHTNSQCFPFLHN
jgi:hypothetical protein